MSAVVQSQLLASAADQAGLNLVKYSIARDSRAALMGAFVVGGLGYVALSGAMREQGVGLSNLNWNVLSSIAGIATGVVIWGEEISGPAQVGVVLGLASLYLLSK